MKLWRIVPNDKLDKEVRYKIKHLLRPVLDVSEPDKCYFCGTETTWMINKRHVCPACSVKYGFASDYRIPDPCEVCGRQGEWCTEGDPVHSLCYIHRDAWFHWVGSELDHIDFKKEPEKWRHAWDEVWAKFVASMKNKEEAVTVQSSGHRGSIGTRADREEEEPVKISHPGIGNRN